MSGRAIPAGTGRDQVHPVGREPRREHRDRDHQPTEAAEAGVGPHHVAVREDVRAADLDDARHLRVVERADEVVEHVGDADRLAAGPHPAGRDHDRQALGQVAQDLERRAAGSDDHRRPELGDRHAMCGELGAGLVAAGQVVGEVGGIVAQTAEVDDPRHAGTPGRLARSCGLPAGRARRIPAHPRPSSAPGSRRRRSPRAPSASVDGSRRSATTTVACGNRAARGRASRLIRMSSCPRAASSGTSRPPM